MDRMQLFERAIAERRANPPPKRRERKARKQSEREARQERDREWGKRALAAIEKVGRRYKEWTRDEVEDYLGSDLPPKGNAWGQIFRAAEVGGRIRPTGETRRSLNPKARGRRVQVWTLAQA